MRALLEAASEDRHRHLDDDGARVAAVALAAFSTPAKQRNNPLAPTVPTPTPAAPANASDRLFILERAIPWSAMAPSDRATAGSDDVDSLNGHPDLPESERMWASDDSDDEEERERKKTVMQRLRERMQERYPDRDIPEEELARIAEIRLKKMKMMQAAYCPSRYHFLAWTAQLLVVLSSCVVAWTFGNRLVSHDAFFAMQPLIIWGEAYAWTILVIEPGYSLTWALGTAAYENVIEYDVAFHSRLFLAYISDVCSDVAFHLQVCFTRLCGCACTGPMPPPPSPVDPPGQVPAYLAACGACNDP